MFKADIWEAYCLLWMSPEWQAKQAVTCGERWNLDLCNCFGNWASYKVFLSFSSLVAWIAETVKWIRDLKIYVDDNASFGCARDVIFYEPYHCYFPIKQIRLLLLWDKLGIPHKQKKHIYGPIVNFIGFEVDPNAMTILLSSKHWASLFQKIQDFAKPGKWHSLKEFQSLGGHMNWSLTVFPLLKPALSTLYAKISGKTQTMRPVCVNNAICWELQWFVKHTSAAEGIFLLKSLAWDPTTDLANVMVCYADASMNGMAFWYPELWLGYQCHIPPGCLAPIFYWEAVVVACAMFSPVTLKSLRLVVYTNNQNTCDI